MMYRILDDRITAEMYIMSAVGWDGCTSRDFTQAFVDAEAEGAKQFVIRINSPGGDIFEAISIYNAIARRKCTAVIEGLAASAASYIAMACQRIEMYDNSMIMIHNAWIYAAGDENYMKRVQEQLAYLKECLLKAYRRTGLSDTELTKMMDEETYLGAQEALEKKFVDAVLQSNQAAPTKAYMQRQFYAMMFEDNQRKVTNMLRIQAALNLPGAPEEDLVKAIEKLRTAKASADDQLVQINKDINDLKEKEKTLVGENASLKQKVTDLEKTQSEQAAAQEEAEMETVIQAALKDGKLLPVEIEKPEQKAIFKAQLKLDKKFFDKMPKRGPLARTPGQTTPAGSMAGKTKTSSIPMASARIDEDRETLRVRAEAIAAEKKISFGQALVEAEAEAAE